MNSPRAMLRSLAITGGLLAVVLHAAHPAPRLVDLASASFLVLMYLSLPAFIWLRARWGTRPAAAAFALSFGYCIVDQLLLLVAP